VTAWDLVAVVVTIAAVAATTALVTLCLALGRTLRAAQQTVERLQARSAPALDAIAEAARQAEAELGRVDGLMDRADSISATIEDASRLGYLAVANPVIRVAALAAGVRHGARRLRLGPDGDEHARAGEG
jgi:hypothetical protein